MILVQFLPYLPSVYVVVIVLTSRVFFLLFGFKFVPHVCVCGFIFGVGRVFVFLHVCVCGYRFVPLFIIGVGFLAPRLFFIFLNLSLSFH